MKRIFYFLTLLILFSCGKEQLSDEAPSMIGRWLHYDATDAWEVVIINEDGTGKVEWYTNNKLHKETKIKTWYVQDNKLYLGKSTFSLSPYDVSQFPVTSSSTIVEGYDTLVQNSRYCVMNNVYFVEKE